MKKKRAVSYASKKKPVRSVKPRVAGRIKRNNAPRTRKSKKTVAKKKKLPAPTKRMTGKVSRSSSPPQYEERMDLLRGEIKELTASVELLRNEQRKYELALREEKESGVHQTEEHSVSTVERSVPSTELQTATPAQEKSDHEQSHSKEEIAAKTKISSLNSEYSELQKKVDALQKYYIAQNQSLERELDARHKVIHQRAEEERVQAESELMNLLRQRDSMRSEVRNLMEERDSIRREIEFARSLSSLIRNPESISEAELAVLGDRFLQARAARTKGSKAISDAQTRAARQYLLSAIEKLSRA
ncbi:MAG: hypothetical protein JRN20_06930 [Nitrososphaerota archaeon]|nr:hypothetical protein [Nitrososphaerota archaeon]